MNENQFNYRYLYLSMYTGLGWGLLAYAIGNSYFDWLEQYGLCVLVCSPLIGLFAGAVFTPGWIEERFINRLMKSLASLIVTGFIFLASILMVGEFLVFPVETESREFRMSGIFLFYPLFFPLLVVFFLPFIMLAYMNHSIISNVYEHDNSSYLMIKEKGEE